MASNEAFAAMRELDRTAAFVTANRAVKCRRETCGETNGLDKRGLCITHQALRLATMRADTVNLAERPARPQATTIASLLSGPSGFAQVSGADLNHCSSAMSMRASLGDVLKKLMQLEEFLITCPKRDSAWAAYDRQYAKLADLVKRIKLHESLVKENWPDLVVAPILIPPMLERAPAQEWLTA